MGPVSSESKPLLIVTGPTASGKTAVAVELANRLNGEIISCDSMQVYRHLSIGTAKPSPKEIQGTAYHLIDYVNPDDQYHLGRFIEDARMALDEIRHRNRQPILCGGTGLYIRGLLYGVFQGGEGVPAIRKKLELRLEAEGLEQLYAELMDVDPVSAKRYGPGDRQRILRALEVFHSSGKPLSEFHEQDLDKPLLPHRLYVLSRSRSHIYEAINKRVDEMISQGLIDEVRKYLEMGWSRDNPAINALGYRELIEAVEGLATLHDALETMKQKSRNYAKRQETWFRSMKNPLYIECNNMKPPQIAAEIIGDWEKFTH